jgi:hypothetical protein
MTSPLLLQYRIIFLDIGFPNLPNSGGWAWPSCPAPPQATPLSVTHIYKWFKIAVFVYDFLQKIFSKWNGNGKKWYFVTKIVLTYCERKLF